MPNPLEGLKKATSISSSNLPPDQPYGSVQGQMMGVMPMGPSGLIGALRGLFQSAPGMSAPAVGETLGEHLPEFTPMGGEDFFNLGRGNIPQVPKIISPEADSLVSRYLSKVR